MKRILTAASLAALVTLLPACRGGATQDTDRLATIEPREDIDPLSNVTFTFRENPGSEAVDDAWSATPWLRFDPPVEGHFRWLGDNVLEFSPQRGFVAATEYRVLAGDSLDDAGAELGRLTTALPELTASHLHWSAADGAAPVLEAELVFSAPVPAGRLAERVRVEHEGRALALRAEPTGRSERVRFLLTDAPSGTAELAWRLPGGWTPPGGNRVVEREFRFTTAVPRKDLLEWRELLVDHDGARGTVTLVLNQGIDAASAERLTEHLAIEPAVELEAFAEGPRIVLRSSGFAMDRSYRVTLLPGLRGTAGGVATEPQSRSVGFGRLRPSLDFMADRERLYLPARGERLLALRAVAVPELEVIVSKVFANNLPAFLGRSMDWDGYWDDQTDEYYSSRRYRLDGMGQEVLRRRIPTASLAPSGEGRLLPVEVGQALERFDGIYVIRVQDPDRAWLADERLVALSDIGLTARVTDRQVLVFAHGLADALPLENVEITVFSTHNQRIAALRTDADGVALYEPAGGMPDGFRPGLVTARLGADFNALPLDRNRVNASRFDVGGFRVADRPYDACVYGERDLYRPGETVHLAAIVRRVEDWRRPGPMPVTLDVLRPDGRTWTRLRKALDEEGSLEADIPLPDEAPTGPWTAELRGGDGSLLHHFRFHVEEFLPDRLRLHPSGLPETAGPGDSLASTVQALTFYGPPAASRATEWSLHLRRVPWHPPGAWPDWTFTPAGVLEERYTREGRTDGLGLHTERLRLPDWRQAGVFEGRVSWTVFDESGRPVYATDGFRLMSQAAFPGIGPVDAYVGTETPMDIPLALVDAAGEAVSGTVVLEIAKREWENNLVESGGSYRYRSTPVERVLLQDEVPLGREAFRYAFTPRLSGEYVARLRMPGSEHAVERRFYAYGWGQTDYRSFEVDNEGRVEITADRDSYRAGDRARLLFRAPFDGRLLVTVERDRVHERHVLETDRGTAELDVHLPSSFVPTVYVTATLIRPMDGSDLPLTVAHGFAPLRVHSPRHRLAVRIEAPERQRSRRDCRVVVHTEPGARVTLAGVDEGILQISGYEGLDPYGWFFRKRALEVGAYDGYGQLYPDLMASAGWSGGGEGMTMMDAKRLNPVDARRVRLVSGWSGLRTADRQGQVVFDLPVPAFAGQIRWMAAAWKDDAFGAADTATVVADPLVVQTALPRFLSPGDELDVTLLLRNTTGQPAEGEAELELEGPWSAQGGRASFRVEPGRETALDFAVRADPAVGVARATASATAFGETFTETVELPVRPASGLLHDGGSGTVSAGTREALELRGHATLDVVTAERLRLTRSPAGALVGHLDGLLRYPYGCLEQTISAAFPQLYFPELAAERARLSGTPTDGSDNDRALYHVREAMEKIRSQQLPGGGLTLWPDQGSAHWWTSAYAAHFLLEAQTAGYAVDPARLDALLGYLRGALADHDLVETRFTDGTVRTLAPAEVAYSLYVLALAGEPDLATMNRYQHDPARLAPGSRYLLAAAYGRAGDRERFAALMPDAFTGGDPAGGDGAFSSGLRDRALVLALLLDLEPEHPQVADLAATVARGLSAEGRPNTQERVFGFLALGRLAQRERGNAATAVVFDGDRELARFDGADLVLEAPEGGFRDLRLETAGTGNVYWYREREGLNAAGAYREVDRTLRVRKTLLDRDGRALDRDPALRQNDLVVVRLTLDGPPNLRIPDVAIADLLPAGLEIENARLRETPDLPWVKGDRPDYLDVRDDRIHVFTDWNGSTRTFHYLARAVRPGKFRMGPAQADAMYRGDAYSVHGGGVLTIRP